MKRPSGHASVEEHPKGSGLYRVRARVGKKRPVLGKGLTRETAEGLANWHVLARTGELPMLDGGCLDKWNLRRVEPGPGFVYFLQSETVGPIKIGTARHVRQRMARIQAMSPHKLHLLCVAMGGRPWETMLLDRFRRFRLHGEWFEPHPQLFDFIRDVKRWGRTVAT